MEPANPLQANLEPPAARQAEPAQESFLDTVQRVALRTLTSFLFMQVACTVATFTAVALGAYTTAASLLIATLLFLAVFKDPVYAEASLIFHSIYYHLNGYTWWSQITQNLYVGALPLQNFGHMEQLLALGRENGAHGLSVISINTHFEVSNSGIFHEPVTPEAWARAGIPYTRFQVEDNRGVDPELLQGIVLHIGAQIAAGRRVYLHCLVGRGRSVSAAEAYLINQQIANQVGERIVDEPGAYAFMQHRRPQASPNENQRAAVDAYAFAANAAALMNRQREAIAQNIQKLVAAQDQPAQ